MVMSKKIYHAENYKYYCNSFHGHVQEDIILYRKLWILIVFMGMSKKILSHAENYKY